MLMLRPWRLCSRGGMVNHSLVALAAAKTTRSTRMDFGRQQSSSSSSSSSSRSRSAQLFGLAGLAGLAAGGVWALASDSSTPLAQVGNEAKAEDYLLQERPPVFPPARVIVNPMDTSGLKLTLFQYQTCPFCCKARAFLDYHGLNYNVVEVNSVTRKQSKWSKYKKVPILVAETPDGRAFQLNDSSLIVSAMASFLHNPSIGLLEVLACYPKLAFREEDKTEKMDIMNKYFLMFGDDKPGRSKDDLVQERKWRRWVDDSLVHTLSPNVYRTPSEALQAFRWFDETGDWQKHFASWERFLVIYAGAAVMWVIGKRLKRRHNIKDDVRQSLYDDCSLWVKSVRTTGHPFMGGEKPDLADLAVFGCLSAIEGCSAFTDLLDNTDIGPWFYATKKAVQEHQGLQ